MCLQSLQHSRLCRVTGCSGRVGEKRNLTPSREASGLRGTTALTPHLPVPAPSKGARERVKWGARRSPA